MGIFKRREINVEDALDFGLVKLDEGAIKWIPERGGWYFEGYVEAEKIDVPLRSDRPDRRGMNLAVIEVAEMNHHLPALKRLRSRGRHRLEYHSKRWWLEWQCDSCYGFDLGLDPELSRDDFGLASYQGAKAMSRAHCLRCLDQERSNSPETFSLSWYSLDDEDWLMRWEINPGEAIRFPLEVGPRFDSISIQRRLRQMELIKT